MNETTSREQVLKSIRNALRANEPIELERVDWEAEIYNKSNDHPDVSFAQEFSRIGGQFVFCESELELIHTILALQKERNWGKIAVKDPQLQNMLEIYEIPFTTTDEEVERSKAGFTRCEFLIARLGCVMVSSAQDSGRRINFLPEIHLVMAYTSQIVNDLKDAFKALKNKYKDEIPSMVTFITGPSRTADIEKTLVMGAHGPKELFVFLIDDFE